MGLALVTLLLDLLLLWGQLGREEQQQHRQQQPVWVWVRQGLRHGCAEMRARAVGSGHASGRSRAWGQRMRGEGRVLVAGEGARLGRAGEGVQAWGMQG